MTTTQRGLQDVLRPVKHVLLDFDGPVCSVFAGLPAPEVAARLSASLAAPGSRSRASVMPATIRWLCCDGSATNGRT